MCQNWDSNLELHDPSTLKPRTTQPEFLLRLGLGRSLSSENLPQAYLERAQEVSSAESLSIRALETVLSPFRIFSQGDEVITLLSYGNQYMVILTLG